MNKKKILGWLLMSPALGIALFLLIYNFNQDWKGLILVGMIISFMFGLVYVLDW